MYTAHGLDQVPGAGFAVRAFNAIIRVQNRKRTGETVSKERRVTAMLLLMAALGLAVVGQFYFFQRPEYLWDGVLLYGLALACFLLAWRLSRPREGSIASPKRSALGAWIQAHPFPAALLAVGLLLSFAASMLVRDRQWDSSTADVVLLWGLGSGAVALAGLWPSRWTGYPWREWPIRLRRVERQIWLEVAALAVLTSIAFALRAVNLDGVPYTLGGDEAWHGLLARQVLSGELRNPFIMGYMSMPTFFYWPVSWSLWLVGDTVVGLRTPAVLVGTLTVPVLFFLVRDLWGKRTAFLAAGFLTAYDYHIHYSRLGANNVWDPLFVTLVLWLVNRGLAQSLARKDGSGLVGGQGSYRALIWAGLAMGLSAYFYTGARLLPVLVIVYLGFIWFQQCTSRAESSRRWRLPWRSLLLLVLAFLIVGGPILSFAMSHPDEWNARINQVGILQSGWLEREPELTGKSTAQILVEQFLRAVGAFHVYPDRTMWYGAERPLLGFVAGIFALLGMGWALVHWRERRYFLILIWFWSVVISGGMLTESPPSSQRLVIAIPAVALFVASGVEQVVRLLWRLLNLDHRWREATMGFLVLLMAVGSVAYYFVEFTPSHRYGTDNGYTATLIGRYLRTQDEDVYVYLFGAPRIYWNFGTMEFLAPSVEGQDVIEPLQGPPDIVDGEAAAAPGATSRSVMFVFLPERIGELELVRQALPGGRLQEVHDAWGSLRFTVYKVP